MGQENKSNENGELLKLNSYWQAINASLAIFTRQLKRNYSNILATTPTLWLTNNLSKHSVIKYLAPFLTLCDGHSKAQTF